MFVNSHLGVHVDPLSAGKFPPLNELIGMSDNPELREKVALLQSKGRKMKGLRRSISEMYRRLESSYKTGRGTEMVTFFHQNIGKTG